jgi:hypothetical protein
VLAPLPLSILPIRDFEEERSECGYFTIALLFIRETHPVRSWWCDLDRDAHELGFGQRHSASRIRRSSVAPVPSAAKAVVAAAWAIAGFQPRPSSATFGLRALRAEDCRIEL